MSWSRRESLMAALTAAAVLMSGCVSPHRPGVRIDSLDADITFGLAVPGPPPSPPGVPQFAAPAEPAPAAAPPGPPELVLPPLPPLVSHAPAAPVNPCPTAREGTFPAQTATEGVTTTPTPGVYRWRPGPPQFFGHDFFPLPGGLGFTYRIINNVSPVTKSTGVDATGPTPVVTEVDTFTYDVTTIRPDGTASIDSFKVESNATRAAEGAPNIGPVVRTGDPGRGVSLTRHIDYDARGQRTAVFDPPDSSPLLLLPLNVVQSEQIQSEANDPTTGATYALTGVVSKRSTVDACGAVVDGWEVDAQTSFTYQTATSNSPTAGGDPTEGKGPSTVTQTASYTYFIATQLGGILTYEHVQPLSSYPTPPTGTAADGVIPGQTNVPGGPALPPAAYEIGIGTLNPAPLKANR